MTTNEDKCNDIHLNPHGTLLGTQRASNPATRNNLVARTWGVFWYKSKIHKSRIPVLFGIIVRIEQKRGIGVENPLPRSFWCGERHAHRCV